MSPLLQAGAFLSDCSPCVRPSGLLGFVEATELEFDLRIFHLHLA